MNCSHRTYRVRLATCTRILLEEAFTGFP